MLSSPIDELQLARTAFVAAHGRFQSDHGSTNLAAWYASLGEALWWIFALDEHYCRLGANDYKELRDRDEDGQVVFGLRLARNRVGHRMALMLQDPRVEADVLLPQISLEQLRWRRYEDLPLVGKRWESTSQEAAYRRHLEGQAARYSLRRANHFFVRRASELDSTFMSSPKDG
jgi:hypothetical protein